MSWNFRAVVLFAMFFGAYGLVFAMQTETSRLSNPLLLDELPGRFIDAELALAAQYGANWREVNQDDLSLAIVRLAESLPPGGAIDLPRSVPCGTLDFRRISSGVQITNGFGGELILGSGQRGIQMLFCDLDLIIDEPVAAAKRANTTYHPFADFKNIAMFDEKAAPATEILGMFCNGGIHIKQDVKNCAWIAGANAFGAKSVTASARVDDCLFLWFGVNWPFSDFNGHLDPKNKGRDWTDTNSQMYFDCKGGGEGTRCFLMIETNYGNPGPGVVLKNCKGMSLYHGSTERASSQGPGVYWLKDCENVQLGLRRIFPATRGGKRGALPTHDITVEGGNGNILHNIESYGNAQSATVVNSDPALQVWSMGCDFETSGLDDKLCFAYTPQQNMPGGTGLEKLKTTLSKRIADKIKTEGRPETKESEKEVERLLLSGRDDWYKINATQEVTFKWGGDDLTLGLKSLSGGHNLPPPPSMPATNAPRVRREIAFTQADGFGKALLDAGADPTGQKPSDDAFAKLMYGMTRTEVQQILEESYKADAEFRTARKKDDKAAMSAAQEKMNAIIGKLNGLDTPSEGGKGKKSRRPPRPRIEIPSGTFLLTQPIVTIAEGRGNFSIWGAGPDKTTLKGTGEIKVLELHSAGGQTYANMTIEGGRVGIAITGQDHNDITCPTLASYLPGNKFYNLVFRNQSFAGMHLGRDEIDLMGGAEHDQNCYVDLKFINTGDYGIFMNQNMLDKWLLLHSDFSGQKKAGISIKFNNLIHGGIIGCTFKDINGPGLDFMGGNPEIAFRPHQVMIDQCDFLECGSENTPALDQGAGVCMSFTRCNVTTKNKAIRTGYMGGAEIYEDDNIDVKIVNDGPAMVLRGVRQNQTARTNGHMLKNVKASGAVSFINDANAYNDFYKKTCDERGFKTNINWDSNDAAHELAPANGWVHPFVFYQCQFGGKKYDYTLVNASTDKQQSLQEIDLVPLSKP